MGFLRSAHQSVGEPQGSGRITGRPMDLGTGKQNLFQHPLRQRPAAARIAHQTINFGRRRRQIADIDQHPDKTQPCRNVGVAA